MILVLGGACGGSDDKSSADPSTTVAGPVSTTAPSSTSGPVTTGPVAASSSRPVTDLVDGQVYWGYLAAFSPGPPATFSIDVSEVYFGKQAIAEATKDHTEGTIEPDIDPVMYVRNNNERTRLLAVAPGVEAVIDGCDYGDGSRTGDIEGNCSLAKKAKLADLPVVDGETAGALVIFVLQGGQISRIEQPYFP